MMRAAVIKGVQFFTRSFTISFGCMRTYGTSSLPDPPYIIASNHQSYFDPFLHGVVLGKIRYMARKSLFRNLLFGPLIRFLGSVELDRDGVDLTAIRKAIEILRHGESLLLFPEGTRTPDGHLGKLKPGVALIAARAGVPVVPAVIDGAFKAWPRNRKLPRFQTIYLAYGKALNVDKNNPRGFQKVLTRAISDLLEQTRKIRNTEDI